LFTFFIRRDFLRAAAFLLIKPLVAALSSPLTAATIESLAAVASFKAIADSTFLTSVRTADF